MTRRTLWLEITIAGFPYALALFFLVLRYYGVSDVEKVLPSKEYLPFIAVVILAISYVLGILAHRLLQIVIRPMMRLVRYCFRRGTRHDGSTPDDTTNYMVRVWQRGSERLNRELDFQFSLCALLQSLVVSVPLLGLSFSLWSCRSQNKFTWGILVLSIAFSGLCILVYKHQQRYLSRLRSLVCNEMDKTDDNCQ